MTSRCYFGKMNSILGSVVPLAVFFKDNRLQFKCGMAIMVHPSRDGLVVLLFLQYQLKLNQVPDPKWLQIPLRGLKIHQKWTEKNTYFFGPKKLQKWDFPPTFAGFFSSSKIKFRIWVVPNCL